MAYPELITPLLPKLEPLAADRQEALNPIAEASENYDSLRRTYEQASTGFNENVLECDRSA